MASFRDGFLFEIIFANSRGGLHFEMNAANIEIGFCKSIGLMKKPSLTFLYTVKVGRYYLEVKKSRWASFRDNFCKLKSGGFFSR